MQSLRPKLWAPLVLVLGGAGAFAASQGAPVEAADHNDPPLRVHSATPATDDRASDIADVFAWVRGTGATQTTVLAMSFDGPNPATPVHALTCDRDVVYQIHITADQGTCETMHGTHACTVGSPSATSPCGQYMPTTGAAANCVASFSDMHTINVRFAQNGSAGCVVQAEFVSDGVITPISPTVAGLTGAPIVSGTTSLYAGLRDDVFFFDLGHFTQTITTGRVAFGAAQSPPVAATDSFAGMNTPVIVLEFPTSAITRSAHAPFGASTTVFRVWGSTARYQPMAT